MGHHQKSKRYEYTNPENSPLVLFIRKNRKKILFGIVCILTAVVVLGFYVVTFLVSKVSQINLTEVSQISAITQYIKILLPQDLIQMVNVFLSLLNFKQ